MPTEQHLEQFIGDIIFLVKVKPVQMMLKSQHCGTTKYFCQLLSPMDQLVKALLMKSFFDDINDDCNESKSLMSSLCVNDTQPT